MKRPTKAVYLLTCQDGNPSGFCYRKETEDLGGVSVVVEKWQFGDGEKWKVGDFLLASLGKNLRRWEKQGAIYIKLRHLFRLFEAVLRYVPW